MSATIFIQQFVRNGGYIKQVRISSPVVLVTNIKCIPHLSCFIGNATVDAVKCVRCKRVVMETQSD
jgi:hypothetical protein